MIARRAVLVALAIALAAPAAAAATVDRSGFRYTRIASAHGPGPARFEPDGPLFAHTKPGFADLRVVDADGRQVPWRMLPATEATPPVPVTVLNRGRRDGRAVALLDLGPGRRVHDRIELVVPQHDFVGRVEVSGSDDRRTFTKLSTTVIYDLAGAERARSTAVVYPPSDFRYLAVSATGIREIAGATVAGAGPKPKLLTRSIRRLDVQERGTSTVLMVDLGFENVPVDELRLLARTPRYDRLLEVEGSNDGRTWVYLAVARVFRFEDSVEAPILLDGRHRHLQLTIENGDDEPLTGIRLEALAHPWTLLIAGGADPRTCPGV